jgi:TonB family protein
MSKSAQHGPDEVEIGESRAHTRADVHSLSYIELGDGNAGIVLNISETGLAIQTIQILSSDEFSQMTFRLPRTGKLIEASGKVVWQIRAKKQAGIEFVGLSDAARTAIKSWMAEQLRPVETEPGGGAQPAREPVVHMPSAHAQGAGPAIGRRPASDGPLSALTPSKFPPRANLNPLGPPSTLGGASASSGNPGNRDTPRPVLGLPDRLPMPQFGYMRGVAVDLKKPRGWWTYTATVGLLAAVAFAAVMTLDPGAITRARIAALIHLQSANAGEQTADQTDQPGKTAQQPAVSSPKAGSPATPNTPEMQGKLPTVLPGDSDTPSASGHSNNSAAPTSNRDQGIHPTAQQNLTSKSPRQGANNRTELRSRTAPDNAIDRYARRSSSQPSRTTAKNSYGTNTRREFDPAGNSYTDKSIVQRSSVPSTEGPAPLNASRSQTTLPSSGSSARSNEASPAVQVDQDAYARRNSSASPGVSTGQSAPTEKPKSLEMPSSYSSPVEPSVPLSGIPSGSVGANSQFRGIRIPPELEAESSHLVGQLEIGQLMSSYSPAYPSDAARKGIEGTVKLFVIVGKEGSVQNVQVLSGPALLTSVSAAAVRDWRYSETFLAGQPIETEQVVTIVFRLSRK